MAQLRLFPRFAGSLFLRIVICALVGTLLLGAVFLLPVVPMERNLEKSATTFAQEGIYPSLYSWCTSQLDSTTDALILMISACDTGEPPFVQAMSGTHNTLSSVEATSNELAAHYGSSIPFDGSAPYYQYWHGYQLIIRPLLSLVGYPMMRILNGIMQTILLLLLCLYLYKAGMKQYILPYLVSVAMLMPVVLAKSLQYSSCYYLLTLGCFAVLRKRNDLDQADGFLFLYLGIATAYFDFLTYPIATLGVPAVLYFCIRKADSFRNTFCRGTKICFSWGVGYLGMWSSKWLIGSLITGKNILAEASAKVAERSSVGSVSDGLLKNMYVALSVNIKAFIRTPAIVLLAVLLCILLLSAIQHCRKHQYSVTCAAKVLFPFAILACLPVFWYLGTTNHSIIHGWFTNKALIVSAFSATAALARLSSSVTE